MVEPLHITILGLSITSSWGNGHATTWRSLTRGLADRGHSVVFLERDVEWYRAHRDLPDPPSTATLLYQDLDELFASYEEAVAHADLVIVGSYVPQGVAVGRWANSLCRGVTAFYDIDTPVTLRKLADRDYEYLDPQLAGSYDCYLSFTGGPLLRQIERAYGSAMARPLYCSVDAELYQPQQVETLYDLGYLGTYSVDRQPPLERLMLDAARTWPRGRFAVAGPQYPADVDWPANVRRIDHLPPPEHPAFYSQQRFTMNITRAEMIRTGHSPSVRLFEAAACGTPIISDYWEGLETVFRPGEEILVSRSGAQTLRCLCDLTDRSRRALGLAARERVLAEHTSQRRAEQLEGYFKEAVAKKRRRRIRGIRPVLREGSFAEAAGAHRTG
jgi:spore maturation protein CgeB